MKPISIPALAALTTILAAFAQSPAAAEKRKREIREVIATGCVRKGAEANCLLLKTLDGKTTYNIVADPAPEPGTVITIDGKPHEGPTTCKQGIAIDVTKWESTGETCVP